MDTPQYQNVSWSYLLLDARMKVTAVVNPDSKLFFGQVIVPDKSLSELICVGQHQTQARKIIDAIRQAMTLKTSQQIEYRSIIPGSMLTVFAYADYMNDGNICFRATALNDTEQSDISRNDLPPTNLGLAQGGGKFALPNLTQHRRSTITAR